MNDSKEHPDTPLSGLYIPPAPDARQAMATSVPQFTELAEAIDPLDMPPGDAHRKFGKKPARQRDPSRDGMQIGISFARTCTVQLAPLGVWWFAEPVLVVRDWDTESEGRGPMVVHDMKARKILTANNAPDLLRMASERGLTVSEHRYLPSYEAAVLKIAQARGLWDGMTLPEVQTAESTACRA